MTETRKLAAILVSDVAGYSRLAGADEDRTLARLRTLRSDLIDPIISVHRGRVVKRTGDGSIIEFRSVVDAVRCAVEVQTAMIERNAGVPPEKRIEFRVDVHLGDVVEESDGDLMGDGVNIPRLRRVLKLTGFVASAPGFNEQPKVIDAASELLVELLGESGRHARSAIGVAELPRDAAVEIEFVVTYAPQGNGVRQRGGSP
jgi:adenylate cyclase